jgi:hypothetical protein
MRFANLNFVIGYLVDEPNKDIIIIGKVDSTLPPLYLEDFIIALRSAWGVYSPNNNPICSIDPDFRVINELQKVGEQVLRSRTTEETQIGIERWRRGSQIPQKVRILGIPFDSRFANTLVQADYNMKRIVTGVDSIDVSILHSLPDMVIHEVIADFKQDKPTSVSPVLNRFWFYSDSIRYETSEDIVLISKCQVVLLTEGVYFASVGRITSTDKSDIFAQKFAKNFTEKYAEIAAERPIFAELENLFRFLALAKIIKYKSSDKKSGLDLTYLLNEYPITTIKNKREIPSLSTIKEVRVQKDIAGGYAIAQLWLPIYGGVDMGGIEINPQVFDNDRKNLVSYKSTVISSRPSTYTLFWDYTNDSGTPIKKPPIDSVVKTHGAEKPEIKNGFEIREKRIDQFKNASVAFNTPKSMMVGETRPITLLVSLSISSDSLKTEITHMLKDKTRIEEIEVDTIKVTEEIEASLTGLGLKCQDIVDKF